MFPVAPEGRLFVIGTAWLAVVTLLFGYTEPGAFLVTLAIALMLVFRKFQRPVPARALGVVAPTDGVVRSVEEARDPFSGGRAWRIVIRQRALGEYNLYVPQEGTVVHRFWPGKETGGDADPQLKDRLGLAFQTDEGPFFSLALDLGHWPRFIRVAATTGNRLGRAKGLGFAGFGGTVVLWLPHGASVSVRPGQRVLGGSDLLGDLPAPAPPEEGGE